MEKLIEEAKKNILMGMGYVIFDMHSYNREETNKFLDMAQIHDINIKLINLDSTEPCPIIDIEIVLERPGILIGKKGEFFKEFKRRLSEKFNFREIILKESFVNSWLWAWNYIFQDWKTL